MDKHQKVSTVLWFKEINIQKWILDYTGIKDKPFWAYSERECRLIKQSHWLANWGRNLWEDFSVYLLCLVYCFPGSGIIPKIGQKWTLHKTQSNEYCWTSAGEAAEVWEFRGKEQDGDRQLFYVRWRWQAILGEGLSSRDIDKRE